ncbi:hypothetical protein FA592_02945 [Sulfurospirillum diekertiae]|jgi:hypothetical protein|uniref:Uncharacterized protein n=1 Tax=Sulfurospirillum diekertiae TaxID=1854492 RepID=A0A6G9VR69_9BACT|nr:hypothetical protein [Sulfurospirillum diekertiae]QIR75239.2 hypothetical protein FA584_03045 [Sulfurospirillum diekertiae]QIR77890.1 hypothetical protein FA592_02945 [Sulfurospirillum diekertiae]
MLQVNLKGSYIEVSDGVLSQIYGIAQLRSLYLHKEIDLNIATAYELSKYLDIFFINARGMILARYERIQTV